MHTQFFQTDKTQINRSDCLIKRFIFCLNVQRQVTVCIKNVAIYTLHERSLGREREGQRQGWFTRETYPNTEIKRCKHLSFKYRWQTLSRCALWVWGGSIRLEIQNKKREFPLLFPRWSHRADYISTVWDSSEQMCELLKQTGLSTRTF